MKTINPVGYRNGKLDGFNQGKENGYKQALDDRIRNEAQLIKPSSIEPGVQVLVIASSIITSLEIGILQPFNRMRDQGELEYVLRLTDEVTKEDIAAAKHIVFMRLVEPSSYQYLEWAHELGKNTIYFIDDNFMAVDPRTEIGMYYLVPERLHTYIKFLKNSKFVKVDSLYFGDYIREHFNRNVIYFPGSVDFELLDSIEKRHKEDNQIVIGYEGGNKEAAFAPVVPALMKVMDYFGGLVRLEFYGFTPSRLIGHKSVTSKEPDPNYREFIKKLYKNSWDIGLAPLENNHFNNCKTNNKFREYSACWIPGIYSDTPPYSSWINNGESGYLVPNTEEEWYKAIVRMIENKEERNRIKETAGKIAREKFNVNLCAEQWKSRLLLKEEA